MGICYIYGAGEHFAPPPRPADGDFVIAADGGYSYLVKNELEPDLIVGDFDSLKTPPIGKNTITLPVEKDDTDLEVGIELGLERGFSCFHIYGATGGRLDHTLANIQCLAYLSKRGARGYLFGRDTVITAIHNGIIQFGQEAEGLLSVFAHSDVAHGVNEKGLKYPLAGATLYNTDPIGISNEFTGLPVSISVEDGTLLVLYPLNAQDGIQ